MAYNVYTSNQPPFRAAQQSAGPGFPPPFPGAGGNRGFSPTPTPQRKRSGRGKWGLIVLIVLAVILIKSGLFRRIKDGVQGLGSSILDGITSVDVQPAEQKPGSGTLSLFNDTVTVGDSALVNYRDASLDYREDGVYTLDASHAQTFELYWPAGEIMIRPYDGDTVEIRETAANGIREMQALRYGMDGTTLFIQYCDFGAAYSALPAKNLTVLVPRALADAALFAKFETGSASLHIEDFSVTDAAFAASSGSVETKNLRAAGTLGIDAASSSVTLDGEIDALHFSSTSGSLQFTGGEALTSVNAVSSSGNLLLSGNIHRASLGTSSGRVEIAAPICPYFVEAETVTGDISLLLPEDADFTLSFESSSGKLQSKLEIAGQDGRYVRGDGIASFTVKSSSGSLQLLPYVG